MKVKINALDRLASEYIRKKAIKEVRGCQRCLTSKFDIQKDDGSIYPAWQQLQCCHFHSRRSRSVRYDPDNMVALDFGCHQYLDSHPQEKIDFFKNYLGEERFELLLARTRNMERIDENAIWLYYKEKIRQLDEELNVVE